MLQCDVTSGVLANITYIGSGSYPMCYIDFIMSPVAHITFPWRGTHCSLFTCINIESRHIVSMAYVPLIFLSVVGLSAINSL